MTRIARRYAKALYKVTDGNLKTAKQYLGALEILSLLFDDKDAGKVLRSPVMPPDLKKTLLHYGLEKAPADTDLKNLVDTLVTVGRVVIIPELTIAFRELIDDVEGVAHAEVESAASLSESEREEVAKELGRLVGKKVVVDTKVDPLLLGGFVARVGNYRIDMSLKSKLEGLAQSSAQDTLR